MRLKTPIRLAALVFVMIAVLPGNALGASQTVVIRNFGFAPVNTIIGTGESITWQNADPVAHTATSETGVFDTGQIAAGATSKTVPFALAGTYAYHCSIHPSMKGTIVVQDPATPMPPTSAPSASPTPSASASTTPTPLPTPAPTRISLASPSPTAAAPVGSGPTLPTLPTLGSGPGPLLAALAVGLAATLAGLAIYLYRRR